MRLTFPYQTERLGAVRIYGMQHVFELDCGHAPPGPDSGRSWGTTVAHVPCADLRAIQERMALVVPCRDERLKVLEGVLTGIPHGCLVIFVSNSARDPVDRFIMEHDSVERFCRFNQRSALVVHQRDRGVAAAFEKAGMPELLDADGRVAHGKGEGMILGIALARLAGRDYVGFVDADNFVPGSVREYVDAYASDFHLARTRFAVVRISWQSKPKVVDGSIFFNRWGRTSENTNRFLNLLLAHLTGFGTEAIRTGNAGEHAMTMEIALRLRFASGFAVEPYELLELFERYGGVESTAAAPVEADVMREGVEIYQVETRNPHFHENRGEQHVDEMRLAAVNAIFHSPICPPRLQEEILEFLRREGQSQSDVPAPPEVTYPALSTLDWATFGSVLVQEAESLEQIVYPGLGGLPTAPPIPVSPEGPEFDRYLG